jgi:hypothetical protein
MTKEMQYLLDYGLHCPSILGNFFSDYKSFLKHWAYKCPFTDPDRINQFKIVMSYAKYLSQDNCNSQRVLDFAHKINANFDTLDETTIDNFANEILFNSELSAEDVRRMSI